MNEIPPLGEAPSGNGHRPESTGSNGSDSRQAAGNGDVQEPRLSGPQIDLAKQNKGWETTREDLPGDGGLPPHLEPTEGGGHSQSSRGDA